MSAITIFSGTFCEDDRVVQDVLARTGYELVSDRDVVAKASRISNVPESRIEKAFSASTSVFNKFTHEKERAVACLRLALAEILLGDNILVSGFVGHLVPEEVNHVLRICLIADMKFRISAAAKEKDMSEDAALKLIRQQDEDRAVWINYLFGKNDPWDISLYDIVIPMGKIGVEGASALIKENLGKDIIQPTADSRKAVQDFLLAAKVEAALTKEGHNIAVNAADGRVSLTINKHVLMLSRLEEDLKSIAEEVKGVKSVETKVGKDFHKADIYRKYDFQTPSKVLIVDDEREFVQSLSERLYMRDMGSAVAYDGESALNLVKEDEPEVMILDLKMPGIDGIEVLRKVKETRPNIEVIILTGHGSEVDREVCMKLGAFAYLQKPVDIDLLSDALRKANEKIQLKKTES